MKKLFTPALLLSISASALFYACLSARAYEQVSPKLLHQTKTPTAPGSAATISPQGLTRFDLPPAKAPAVPDPTTTNNLEETRTPPSKTQSGSKDIWIEEKKDRVVYDDPDNETLPTRHGSSVVLFETYTERAKEALEMLTLTDAARLFERALDQTNGWPIDDNRVVSTITRLMEINSKLGDRVRAAYYRHQLTVIGKLTGGDGSKFLPHSTTTRDSTAATDSAVGEAEHLYETRSYAAAAVLYRNALKTTDSKTQIERKTFFFDRLVRCYCMGGLAAEAMSIVDAQIAEAEKILAADQLSKNSNLAMANVLSALSFALFKNDKDLEAETIAVKAKSYLDMSGIRGTEREFLIGTDLGAIHIKLKKFAEASKELRDAAAIGKSDNPSVNAIEMQRCNELLATAIAAGGGISNSDRQK